MDPIDNNQTRRSQKRLKDIRMFLAQGGNPNHHAEGKFKETFLHVESRLQDNYEIVEELLNAGANVNLPNYLGQTPLHIAVIHRNRRVVNLLIEFGATVNTRDCLENFVLHYAIHTCTSMEYGNWNCTNPNYCSHRDIDVDIIAKLLQHESVNVNVRNYKGDTPLLWAVKYRNVDVVKALLRRNAIVDIANYLHETPLHVALYTNPDLEIASELLLYDACVACIGRNGQNSLELVFNLEGDDDSRIFAKKFLMRITFFGKNNELVSLKLQHKRGLLKIFENCKKEVSRMRNEIIPGIGILYDFVHRRMIERTTEIPETEICNEIYNIIKTKKYVIYAKFILSFIEHRNLY